LQQTVSLFATGASFDGLRSLTDTVADAVFRRRGRRLML
jgi:hypothetical protein